MEIRVITLRYSEGSQGFPEDALRRACAGREVLEVSEHYFVYGNIPHLTLVLKLSGSAQNGDGEWRSKSGFQDLEVGLDENDKHLYRELKKWRNERAKRDGKPAYAIGRNTLILEIVKAHPTSLSALKEVDGMGEGSVEAYGKEIVEIVANVPRQIKAESKVGIVTVPQAENGNGQAEFNLGT